MLILLPPSEKKRETSSPTPAISVYSGVLYQALDWLSLTASAKKRASSSVVIPEAVAWACTPLVVISGPISWFVKVPTFSAPPISDSGLLFLSTVLPDRLRIFSFPWLLPLLRFPFFLFFFVIVLDN